MGEIVGPTPLRRRAKEEVPQLVIDPDAVAFDPGKIIIKHTEDGGYLCLGFGPSAEFLRAVDEDRNLGSRIDEADAAQSEHGAPFAKSDGPFLRRLGKAVALAKDYNPDQPRDEQGRWTSEGVEGAATGFVSNRVVAAPGLVPALRQLAARLFSSGIGGPASAAVAFFGTLFIPTNNSLISEGAVPDGSNLGYRFDQGTGVLSLTRTNEDGSKDELFYGRYSSDGFFRDKDGNIIGRHLGGSVVIDADAVPGYRSARSTDEEPSAGARTDAATDTDEPKLCPAPIEESTEGRKQPALRYQEQISHIPRGFQFVLTDPATVNL